jgi:hypothetical protein
MNGTSRNRMPAGLLVLAACLLLAACGGRHDARTVQDPLIIGGEDADATNASLYQMPTPNELFELVRGFTGAGDKRLLNPAEHVRRYVGHGKRAVNFGIYCTDLVYASSFKLNVEVARYYLAASELAEGLGVAAAFNDEALKGVKQGVTMADSLPIIGQDAYLRAYTRLIEEGRGATLALVLAGGWVEGTHLLMQHGGGADWGMAQRIVEQHVALDQLLEIMAHHASDQDVQELRQALQQVSSIYQRLPRLPHPAPVAAQDGRLVIGDDHDLELTGALYEELSTAVNTLRERLIRPEDL